MPFLEAFVVGGMYQKLGAVRFEHSDAFYSLLAAGSAPPSKADLE